MSSGPGFRSLEHSTRFTFVRHGESEGNKLRIIQGHNDSPLSDAGREHARAAGRWLHGTQVDRVFTSPLARSTETASIIAETAGTVTPEVVDDLKELDTGAYSGKSLRERRAEDPDGFKQFMLNSWDSVDGAESRESLLARALTVWEMLISEANGGCTHLVCVTHGGMLQWIIKATIGVPGQRWVPVFGMANCGISTLRAESTSLDIDEPLPPNTGFFANWEQINHVPY